MNDLPDFNVAVIGLGLMGGSLAWGLRGQCRWVVGYDRNPDSVAYAIENGLIDAGAVDLPAALLDADMVVLAAPVRAIIDLLDEIVPWLSEGCLVMDLGSTKVEIMRKMVSLPSHVQVVGAHPMCGKEQAGIKAADLHLYRGAPFLFTPVERTSPAALEMAFSLACAVGAHPMMVEPDRHDRLAAMVSHLPYLLACSLVGTAEKAAEEDDLLWDVAVGGFRDTSRVAASDVTMMCDILFSNQQPILAAIHQFSAQLNELETCLVSGDRQKILGKLSRVQKRRQSLAVAGKPPVV